MKQQMPKVSVIVPVYGVEQYISRCIGSILHQTYTDWELILVDDGSPDKSGTICDEYASRDERIRVFHQENGGVSSARNKGLDTAKGEWICFLDGDDALEETTLSECFKAVREDVDIVQFSFTQNEEELGKESNDDTTVLTWQEYIRKRAFLACVWGAIIRTTIIRDHNIRFDESMRLAEDQLFMFTYFAHSRMVAKVNRMLYYYADNGTSATHNEKVDDLLLSSRKCIAFKMQYPEFAFRMDDLVLFFIEKLILAKEFEACKALLQESTPSIPRKRALPTRLMVRLSRKSIPAAITFERLFYPPYISVYNAIESSWKSYHRK